MQVGRKFANTQSAGTTQEVKSLNKANARGKRQSVESRSKATKKRKRDAWQAVQGKSSQQCRSEEVEAQRQEVAAATKSLHHQIGQQVCIL